MKTRLLLLGFAVLSASLVACGGGGGTGNPIPTATSTPTAAPTNPPINPGSFSAGPQSNPIPSSGTQATIPVPSAGGISGSVGVSLTGASVPANTTATDSLTSTAPGNAPVLSVGRIPEAARHTMSGGLSNATVIAYASMEFNNTVTFQTLGQFAFTLPSTLIVPGANYYIAFYDPTQPQAGWQADFAGPAAISGTTLTFTPTITAPITFQANTTYWFALYAISSAVSQPTPGPTPPPASEAQRPAGIGDQFAFTGSSTQSDVYYYPQPSPLPSTSVTTGVQQQITVTSTPDPFAALGLDFHTVETDTQPLVTSTLTSDSWYGDVTAPAGENFVLYGWRSADSNAPTPDTFQYFYNTPQVLDELPETSGAAWSNNPAVTIQEIDADGTTADRTYKSDGSYVETQRQPLGTSATITENSDGSGSYAGNYLFSGQVASITFSAPSPQPSASPAITVSINFPTPPPPAPGASPSPTTAPIVLTVPQWYQTPPQLYTESDTVTTGVTFPSACLGSSGGPTSGNVVTQTINRLDTILGYTEQTTTNTYVAPAVGPVCVTMTDVQNTYYDYLGDQLSSIALSNTIQHTTTISETLQAAPVSSSGTLRAESAQRAGITPVMFTAARAKFYTAIENERQQRLKAFRTYFKRLVQHEGVSAR